jgi:TolB-like protein/class 3 adenylate cyclase/tetratricopeptide (TPR) repeat protein
MGLILSSERVERRLAAVLAADVAGYSRLMGLDEERTLANLKSFRKTLVDPSVAAHRGRIVKTTGDGMLVEFASAVDAARCAMEVQSSMAAQNADVPQDVKIEFRIGIHVGDIIIDDNDIFGDGVNIAARLEGIAEPGGICISDDAQRQVRGKVDFAFGDLGLRTLKNIAEPMRAWRMQVKANASAAASIKPPDETAQPLALPDKPSIAVLPFQNMSGDPEQEYFADGMVEDIITGLSRMRWLFVIARNSSFTYKGRAVDVKQVGRELGVRYVLEGSVRKAANRLRITGQLIDSSTGAHLWADRFDGTFEDIFDLQDQITTSVVGAIAPKLEQAEIERAKRKPTGRLDAYDYYLRGMATFYQRSNEANSVALQLFSKAIELDAEFASAYAMAAWCYVWRKLNGWMIDRVQETAEAARLAQRAVELGQDDAVALTRGGHTLGFILGDLDSAIALIDRALVLDPNLAAAWMFGGWMRAYRGEPDEAIERHARAMRPSPLDPSLFQMQAGTAFAHLLAGRYDDASLWAEKAFRGQLNYLPAAALTAASNALAGRMEEARQGMERVRRIDPALRLSNLKNWYPIRRAQDLARLAEGLRKAGLPE